MAAFVTDILIMNSLSASSLYGRIPSSFIKPHHLKYVSRLRPQPNSSFGFSKSEKSRNGVWTVFASSASEKFRIVEIDPADVDLLHLIATMYLQKIQIQVTSFASWKVESNPTTFPVNVYAAKITNSLFQGKKFVLKEYPPASSVLAANELAIYERFKETSDWPISGDRNTDSPILNVLGYFYSAPMKEEESQGSYVESSEDGQSTWLAFGTGSLKAAYFFPQQKQSRHGSWLDFFNPFEPSFPIQKAIFLKKIVYLSLEALNYCHVRGVIHGSLNSSCIILNTFDQWKVDFLTVKLTGFGLSTDVSRGVEGVNQTILSRFREYGINSGLEVVAALRQLDVHHLGLGLLEVIYNALSRGSSSPMAPQIIRKVWVDVHDLDIVKIREHFSGEDEWEQVVEFLDQGNGWQFFQSMLKFPSLETDELMNAKFLFDES